MFDSVKDRGRKIKETALKVGTAISCTATTVMTYAVDTIKPKTGVKAENVMGKVIGYLLQITQYLGVGLFIFGVYEVVMSFTQDMADKRAKGIALAFAGAFLIALKSVLKTLGVI